jgi:hypothetical protein
LIFQNLNANGDPLYQNREPDWEKPIPAEKALLPLKAIIKKDSYGT